MPAATEACGPGCELTGSLRPDDPTSCPAGERPPGLVVKNRLRREGGEPARCCERGCPHVASILSCHLSPNSHQRSGLAAGRTGPDRAPSGLFARGRPGTPVGSRQLGPGEGRGHLSRAGNVGCPLDGRSPARPLGPSSGEVGIDSRWEMWRERRGTCGGLAASRRNREQQAVGGRRPFVPFHCVSFRSSAVLTALRELRLNPPGSLASWERS